MLFGVHRKGQYTSACQHLPIRRGLVERGRLAGGVPQSALGVGPQGFEQRPPPLVDGHHTLTKPWHWENNRRSLHCCWSEISNLPSTLRHCNGCGVMALDGKFATITSGVCRRCADTPYHALSANNKMKLSALPAEVVVSDDDAVAFAGFGLSAGDTLPVRPLWGLEQQIIGKATCVVQLLNVDERDGGLRFKGHCCNVVSEVEQFVGDMADCLPRCPHSLKLKVLRPRKTTPKLVPLDKWAIVAMLVLLRQKHDLYADITGNVGAWSGLPDSGMLSIGDLSPAQIIDPAPRAEPGGAGSAPAAVQRADLPHAEPLSACPALRDSQERAQRGTFSVSGLCTADARHAGARSEQDVLASTVCAARRRALERSCVQGVPVPPDAVAWPTQHRDRPLSEYMRIGHWRRSFAGVFWEGVGDATEGKHRVSASLCGFREAAAHTALQACVRDTDRGGTVYQMLAATDMCWAFAAANEVYRRNANSARGHFIRDVPNVASMTSAEFVDAYENDVAVRSSLTRASGDIPGSRASVLKARRHMNNLIDHLMFFDDDTMAIPSVFVTYTLPSKSEDALMRLMATCDDRLDEYEASLSDRELNQDMRMELFRRHPLLVTLFFLSWREKVEAFWSSVYGEREIFRKDTHYDEYTRAFSRVDGIWAREGQRDGTGHVHAALRALGAALVDAFANEHGCDDRVLAPTVLAWLHGRSGITDAIRTQLERRGVAVGDWFRKECMLGAAGDTVRFLFVVMAAEALFATVRYAGSLDLEFLRPRMLPHEFDGLSDADALRASEREVFETMSEFERGPACVEAQQHVYACGVRLSECRLRMLEGCPVPYVTSSGSSAVYTREGGSYRGLRYQKALAWRLVLSFERHLAVGHDAPAAPRPCVGLRAFAHDYIYACVESDNMMDAWSPLNDCTGEAHADGRMSWGSFCQSTSEFVGRVEALRAGAGGAGAGSGPDGGGPGGAGGGCYWGDAVCHDFGGVLLSSVAQRRLFATERGHLALWAEIQLHTQKHECRETYCCAPRKEKRVSPTGRVVYVVVHGTCRFNFKAGAGKPLRRRPGFVRHPRWVLEFAPRRNHPWLNATCPLMGLSTNFNTDMKKITSHMGVTSYLTKYAAKTLKTSVPMWDMVREIGAGTAAGGESASKAVTKLYMDIAGQADCTRPEALMRLLSPNPFTFSLDQVGVWLNGGGSSRIDIDSLAAGGAAPCCSVGVLGIYASRREFAYASGHLVGASLAECCLQDFLAHIDTKKRKDGGGYDLALRRCKKGSARAKQHNVEPRVVVVYDCVSEMDVSDEAWCRQELMMLVPWAVGVAWPLAASGAGGYVDRYFEEVVCPCAELEGVDPSSASAEQQLSLVERHRRISRANGRQLRARHTRALRDCVDESADEPLPYQTVGAVDGVEHDASAMFEPGAPCDVDVMPEVDRDAERRRYGLSDVDIDYMVTWLGATKRDNADVRYTAASLQTADYSLLNLRQRFLVLVARWHRDSGVPLRALVLGDAGTGKSRVMRCLEVESERAGCPSKTLAPTGVAAMNVGGCTLHSGYQFPVEEGTEHADDPPKHPARFQEVWRGVQQVIIDEVSQVGGHMLAKVSNRHEVHMGDNRSGTVMGGLRSSTLVGDIEGQMDPHGGSPALHTLVTYAGGKLPAFKLSLGSEKLARYGGTVLAAHDTVVLLDEQMRQRGVGGSAESRVLMAKFHRLIRNLRYGVADMDDYFFTQSAAMQLGAQPLDVQVSFADAPRIFMSWVGMKGQKGADSYNEEQNRRMGVPLHRIDAVHSGSGAAKYKSRDARHFGGVPPSVVIGVGSRIMNLRNKWTNAGLVNGLQGVVRAIIFRPGNDTGMPDCILVRWDESYKGPSWEGSVTPRVTPLVPETEPCSSARGVTRTGYAITLCFGISVTKAQGLTLPRVVVHFGRTMTKFHVSEYIAITRGILPGVGGLLFGDTFGPDRIVGMRHDTRQLGSKTSRRAGYESRKMYKVRTFAKALATMRKFSHLLGQAEREVVPCASDRVGPAGLVAQAVSKHEAEMAMYGSSPPGVHYMFRHWDDVRVVLGEAGGRRKTVIMVRADGKGPKGRQSGSVFPRRVMSDAEKDKEGMVLQQVRVGEYLFICCAKRVACVRVDAVRVCDICDVSDADFHRSAPLLPSAAEARRKFYSDNGCTLAYDCRSRVYVMCTFHLVSDDLPVSVVEAPSSFRRSASARAAAPASSVAASVARDRGSRKLRARRGAAVDVAAESGMFVNPAGPMSSAPTNPAKRRRIVVRSGMTIRQSFEGHVPAPLAPDLMVPAALRGRRPTVRDGAAERACLRRRAHCLCARGTRRRLRGASVLPVGGGGDGGRVVGVGGGACVHGGFAAACDAAALDYPVLEHMFPGWQRCLAAVARGERGVDFAALQLGIEASHLEAHGGDQAVLALVRLARRAVELGGAGSLVAGLGRENGGDGPGEGGVGDAMRAHAVGESLGGTGFRCGGGGAHGAACVVGRVLQQLTKPGGHLVRFVDSGIGAPVPVTRDVLASVQPRGGGFVEARAEGCMAASAIEAWLWLVCARSGPGWRAMPATFYSRLAVACRSGDICGGMRGAPRVGVGTGVVTFVPVHSPGHWSLAVVDNLRRRLEFYDSNGGHGMTELGNLERLVEWEAGVVGAGAGGWTLVSSDASSVPQQDLDSVDCGPFVCCCADHLAAGDALDYASYEMEHVRMRISVALLTGEMEWSVGDRCAGGCAAADGGSDAGGDSDAEFLDDDGCVDGHARAGLDRYLGSVRSVREGARLEAAGAAARVASRLDADPTADAEVALDDFCDADYEDAIDE